jgi:hypothetical protein
MVAVRRSGEGEVPNDALATGGARQIPLDVNQVTAPAGAPG